MQLPGLDTAPDVTIARFVADTNAALEGTGAELGISVFGISATRPEPTAQDMRLLAPHVDYVSPMVYPSHWSSGEYEVADPVRQPADIVTRSVADFERIVAGSGAAVVPWLQDFSWGSVIYGPAEVRAQIDAARAVGAEGFLLWNPTSQYNDRRPRPTGGTDVRIGARWSDRRRCHRTGAWRRSRSTPPPTATPCRSALVADLTTALDTAEADRRRSVRAIVLTHTPAGVLRRRRPQGAPRRATRLVAVRRACCGG